jgi:Tol biopolymer transport system component
MSSHDRFERSLPGALADLAAERSPDYVDDLLARTARQRQRPAWQFPERWLPMTITLRRTTLAPPLWLLAFGFMILLALLAAGALLPFLAQPAVVVTAPRNGPIAFNPDAQHLHTIDPVTGDESLFMLGDPGISFPVWSPDGTRLASLVDYPDGTSAVDTGGDAGPTTSHFQDVRALRWSPDGSRLLLVSSVDDKGAITLIPADSPDAYQTLDRTIQVDWAIWNPDGSILFKGVPADGIPRLYTLSLDAPYAPEPILSVDATTPLFRRWGESEYLWDPSYSPDGAEILYSTVVDLLPGMAPDSQNARAHLVDADGSNDRLFEYSPESTYETAVGWSPDGTRVALRVQRDSDVLLVIAALDRASDPVVIGPAPSVGTGMVWAPDGTTILTWGDNRSAAFVDSASGAVRPLRSRIVGDVAAWQPVFR